MEIAYRACLFSLSIKSDLTGDTSVIWVSLKLYSDDVVYERL